MPIELKCPGCGKMVRVPDARLGDDPRCGACGTAVAPGMVGVDLGQLFQEFFAATSPPPTPPPVPRPWSRLLRVALRSSGLGSAAPQIFATRRERLMCGLLGILAGAVAFVVGVIVGTLIMNAVLAALGVRQVMLPAFVVSAAYAAALYGALVSLAGTERVLGAVVPIADARAGFGRVLRLAILTAVGLAELLAVWMLVHALELADFRLQ